MKKLLIPIAILFATSAMAQGKQPTPPVEKTYHVEFTRQMLDSINKYSGLSAQILGTSNWPTNKTLPIIQFIGQIQALFNQAYQVAVADSVKKPKNK